MTTITMEECKKILFRLGIKFGVSPKLISERLLSDRDKNDMMEGSITIDSLEHHVEAWMASGMPDIAHGKTEPYQEEKNRLSAKESNTESVTSLRKPFIEHGVVD